jgi:ABC-type antimicrobial peptide transport system permease subunit
MKKLGIKDPQDMIGKSIRLNGGNKALPVTAVVKDFASNTLRTQTKPVIILADKQNYTQIAVKLNTANFAGTLRAVQQLWESVYPDYAYSSSFLDENIASFYDQERKLSVLYKIFAALAIFISSLGLYGLISFMAVQRTKEIGIRKVLGASVMHIVYLFSKEFTVLIIVAFAIAVPVGYLIMNNWLNNFAYRIHAGIGVFALAILISIVIAWITVGAKAIKAAIANPVRSLRSE